MGSRLIGGHSLYLSGLVDVAVDEVKVLGHSGVDAGAVPGVAAPKADDARQDEGPVSAAHERTTVVPLWKHTALLN